MSKKEQLRQKFYETFDMGKFTTYLPMKAEYEISEEQSQEDFAVYSAVMAKGGENLNNVIISDYVLRRMPNAVKSGDVNTYVNHNTSDLPMGDVLSAQYKDNQVIGDFNILRDIEGTNDLIRRIDMGVVSDVSPGFRDVEVTCNVPGCGERMLFYGGCRNNHFLGDTIKVEGKDFKVTGTMVKGTFKELSVVGSGAIPGVEIFAENQDLINEAYHEGIINDRVLSMVYSNYSVDLTPFIKPSKTTTIPNNQGGLSMANPKDADAKILQDRVTDLEAEKAELEAQVASYKDHVAPETFQEKEDKITELNASIIEKDTEIAKNKMAVEDYTTCIAYAKAQAISFYAKVRGVEEDNETDILFMSRKKSLEESQSLAYLIGALCQYQEDYYKGATQFGGKFNKKLVTPLPGDYVGADGYE